MKLALVHSTIRGDEKLLIAAAKRKKIDLELIDIRQQVLDPNAWQEKPDVVLVRCVSNTMGMHAISFFESIGVPTVNSSQVSTTCENKFATSLALQKKKIPTVPFAMAFTEDQAKEAIEALGGYPVVLKPTQGSWGRLLAKVNDDDALEAILEQKMVLGTPPHKAFYFQQFVQKPGRDIRVTMVGNKVVCAIYRAASHWITNTARGAKAQKCQVDGELNKISRAASKAVGGGILGIDIFETKEGYLVNEINHTTEFKNVQRVTKIDVAGAMIDYCLKVADHD